LLQDDDEEGLVSGSAAAQLEARLSEIIFDDAESPIKQKPNILMPPGFWPPIPNLNQQVRHENRGNFENINGSSTPLPIFNQFAAYVFFSACIQNIVIYDFFSMGHNQQMQQHMQQQQHNMPKPPQVMTVRTVEDLERDLRAKSQPVNRAVSSKSDYIIRLFNTSFFYRCTQAAIILAVLRVGIVQKWEDQGREIRWILISF